MKSTLLFLALLCGAVAGETPAPKTDLMTGLTDVITTSRLSNPSLDDLIRGSPVWRAEAADVVLALKIMDQQREWLELLTQYLLSNAPLEDRMTRAKQYADDKAERDKRIAWARTILAKWEARAK